MKKEKEIHTWQFSVSTKGNCLVQLSCACIVTAVSHFLSINVWTKKVYLRRSSQTQKGRRCLVNSTKESLQCYKFCWTTSWWRRSFVRCWRYEKEKILLKLNSKVEMQHEILTTLVIQKRPTNWWQSITLENWK